MAAEAVGTETEAETKEDILMIVAVAVVVAVGTGTELGVKEDIPEFVETVTEVEVQEVEAEAAVGKVAFEMRGIEAVATGVELMKGEAAEAALEVEAQRRKRKQDKKTKMS